MKKFWQLIVKTTKIYGPRITRAQVATFVCSHCIRYVSVLFSWLEMLSIRSVFKVGLPYLRGRCLVDFPHKWLLLQTKRSVEKVTSYQRERQETWPNTLGSRTSKAPSELGQLESMTNSILLDRRFFCPVFNKWSWNVFVAHPLIQNVFHLNFSSLSFLTL